MQYLMQKVIPLFLAHKIEWNLNITSNVAQQQQQQQQLNSCY